MEFKIERISKYLGPTIALFCMMVGGRFLLRAAAQEPPKPPPNQNRGWQTYSIGAGRGNLSVSIGAVAWANKFHIRNLIFGGTVDLWPGARYHLLARRREGNWSRMPFHPDIDESYLEQSGYYSSPGWNIALDLKIGRVRYLQFPYPDAISDFDQVPGISDLTGGPSTDYRGALFTFEAANRSGLGFHFGGIDWGFDHPSGINAVEWYLFFRHDYGIFHLEGRLGALANRMAPLGQPAREGGSIYAGVRLGDFTIGALYEKKRLEPTYTGVMVQFRSTAITRALGAVSFDYFRQPAGFGVQVPVYKTNFGSDRKPPAGSTLVGEIAAVRMHTYWQQGFVRNSYEHRLWSWGRTSGPGLHLVVKELPAYLQLEALVSPHTSLNRAWFRDRQGPAQIAQEVFYQFYAVKGK